ncbi:hypothetical protein DSM104443_00467 [Usitatibacter rugosus]|uniref:Uncharacterized protein n=1 Tax=Usitatibacter rugosus TaxID=2732067 RepID=A0A6M4GSZ1_9PROT|nr:hypothetical protein DSM104443_00467 [Usitatibacter rugosus]
MDGKCAIGVMHDGPHYTFKISSVALRVSVPPWFKGYRVGSKPPQ